MMGKRKSERLIGLGIGIWNGMEEEIEELGTEMFVD